MNDLYRICMELRTLSGTNDKKAFLGQHRHNASFNILLKFLLNPRIITGISEAKINKKIQPTEVPLIVDFEGLCKYLEENNTGRDIDILVCQAFIRQHEVGLKTFISSVVTKSLKLGVDVKTVNAVYGNDFIPIHEVQQGSPRDKLRLKNGEPFFLTQKLNGTRGTYVKGSLLSRQGTAFTGLEHIITELKIIELSWGLHLVFDGELVRKNIDNVSDNENFRIGTGIINSDAMDKSCIEFIVFDILPLQEFYNKESAHKYLERRSVLEKSFEKGDFKHLGIVPLLYHGTDQLKIDELLEYADNQGWEGLMLNKDIPYYCKRHSGLIKIKTFKYSDLKIIGYEEGSGKYVGMLGSIIVEYKGNEVSVGTGLTDEQRIQYWGNRDWLIGKIAEIKYKDESQDKETGLKSLQFPIWCGLRLDKTEPSLES